VQDFFQGMKLQELTIRLFILTQGDTEYVDIIISYFGKLA
jgi:hypothetical protein